MDLQTVIDQFDAVSLKEIDRVKLQNRTDLKFATKAENLPAILLQIKDFYRVLEIKGQRIMLYRSQYYDTKDFFMYHSHHNGKLNRYKVRQRDYVTTNDSFFEVKFKANVGRTIKKRVSAELLEKKIEFIKEYTPFSFEDLEPKINNNFLRITLAHKINQERVTIDLNVGFTYRAKSVVLPFLSIIEIKQDGSSQSSMMVDILREMRLLPTGMSKYCLGTALLVDEVKKNLFKAKLRDLAKLSDDKTSFLYD